MATRPSRLPNRRFPELRDSSQVQLCKENQRRAKNRQAQRNHRKLVKERLEELDRLKCELYGLETRQNHGDGQATPSSSADNRSISSLMPTPPDNFLQMIDIQAVLPPTPRSGGPISPFSVGDAQDSTEDPARLSCGEIPLPNLQPKNLQSDALLSPDQAVEFSLDDFSIPEARPSANRNPHQSHSRSLLHHAVILNDEKMISVLLEHGADVRSLDGGRRTPLHLAALLGHEKAARLLLQHGAAVTISSADEAGLNPIHLAIQNRHASIVGILAEFGADVNLQF
ncbi:putative RING-type E3 ubiquitin transferase [Microsporum canis]